MKIRYVGGAVASVALSAALGLSAHTASAAQVSGDAYSISVSGAPAGSVSMRVTGPGGFAAISDSLSFNSFSAMPDGQYSYEITGSLPIQRSAEAASYTSTLDNGRSASRAALGQRTGVLDAGYFRIQGGVVLSQDASAVEE